MLLVNLLIVLNSLLLTESMTININCSSVNIQCNQIRKVSFKYSDHEEYMAHLLKQVPWLDHWITCISKEGVQVFLCTNSNFEIYNILRNQSNILHNYNYVFAQCFVCFTESISTVPLSADSPCSLHKSHVILLQEIQ